MKTAKVENYTADMTATIKAEYINGIAIEKIAEKVGRTVRSVVAKLSREGVYKKKAYTTKTGEKAETKGDIVEKIAFALNVPAENVGSLEGATKQALKLVLMALVE